MFKPKLLSTVKTYDKKQFFADSISGIIVGIVAIPLAIAFGIASGVGPAEGLITAVIAGFIISFLGGSKVQIGGPTGAFIVIVYGIIQKYGISGLMISTIMAGIMLVFMGIFQFGTIIKFVPYPVIAGFTGGIAVVIFSTQINDLFGMNLQNVPSHFIDKWIYYVNNLQYIDLWSFGLAAAGIIIIIMTSKFSRKIPGALVVILVLTPVVILLKNYGLAENVKTISDNFTLPNGLPKFILPQFIIPEGMTITEYIRVLLSPAFTIAMLGAIESLLSAMVADGAIGDNHDSNTELVAQGIANICVPFFGGIPATGAIARTMTNINNGGRTPVSGIIHAIFLLLVMLVFGQLIGYIPMPCLAAILVIVAYNMSDWRTFIAMRNHPKSDFAVLLITFFLTVIFDLTIAIEVGLLLAIVLFLKRTNENTTIRTFHDEIDPADNSISSETQNPAMKLEIPDKVEIFEIDGPYFFGIANKFDDIMRATASKHLVRIIRMGKIPFMDSTGLKNFEILCKKSKKEKITIIICGVNMKVKRMLVKTGISDIIGNENFCMHIDIAIKRAKEIIAIEEENVAGRKTQTIKTVN